MVCVPTGIVIVGEDTVGHFDLGIFVASIVPNGPADRDGRIRPGRESYGHFYFIFMYNCVQFIAEVCFTSPLFFF